MKKELSEIKEMVAGLLSFLEKAPNLEKKAYNLFSLGDVIVAYNEIEGITKGQKYRVTDQPRPGYITIEDIFGNEIGMFKADRFVLDNEEY